MSLALRVGGSVIARPALDAAAAAAAAAASPSASVVTATGSTAPRSLASRFADVCNVKDFGAVGDGVTDDTAAFVAALAAAKDGVEVRLPRGRFRITAPIEPPMWSGNGGHLSQVVIRGAANAYVDDVYGVNTYASSIVVDSPQADTPVFSLAGGRGIRFERVSFIGAESPVAGSVAVHLVNYNKQTTFVNCTFAGWDEAVRIGTSGEAASYNNDDLVFRDCLFLDCNVAISNYGTESYAVRCSDSTFYTQTGYKTTADAAGTVMNSFQAFRCVFGTQLMIDYNAPGGVGHAGRSIVVLDSCLLEPSGYTNGRIFYTENDAANNHCGLVVRNCTLNLGADDSSVYDSAFSVIRYRGLGPVIIENNIIGGLGRIPFDFWTAASGWNSSAVRIANNVFTTARPAIRYPINQPYPTIIEEGNIVRAEAKHKITDPYMASLEIGEPDRIVRGVRSAVTSPKSYQTWRVGSYYEIGETGNTTVRGMTRQSGTVGTLTGVTGAMTYNSATFTLDGGTVSERRKIRAGAFLKFAGLELHEVDDVIGDTVYLRTAYQGSTASGVAVDLAEPVIAKERRSATAAPASGYWLAGDVTWRSDPSVSGPTGQRYVSAGWYNTTSGTPGGWEEMRIPVSGWTALQLPGSKTWDPGNVTTGSTTTTTVTVTGATVGQAAVAGFTWPIPAGCVLSAAVTAADTVTVTLYNNSGSDQDLASGTLSVRVLQ